MAFGVSEMNKMERKSKCSVCNRTIVVGSKDFPFCSPKCQLLDLSMWLNEEYRMRAPLTERNFDEFERAMREQGELL